MMGENLTPWAVGVAIVLIWLAIGALLVHDLYGWLR